MKNGRDNQVETQARAGFRSLRAAARLAGCWLLVGASVVGVRAQGIPGLQREYGLTGNASEFETLVYDGSDPLLGTSGRMRFSYARSRSLLAGDPLERGSSLLGTGSGQTTLFATDVDESAWALQYETAENQRGLSLRLRMAEVGEGYEGDAIDGAPLALSGMRQRDFQAGWQSGSFGFTFGRDRLMDADEQVGLTRDLFGGELLGFSYQRQALTIDADARFDGQLNRYLVGKEGYSLQQRKLGDARAGFADLNALAGLTDTYESFGFAEGDLSVDVYDRSLDHRGAGLIDRARTLRFGGLSLSQTTRALDLGFEPYQEAGYQHWRALQGGREDRTAAALDFEALDLSWSDTRLWQNRSGREGAATITETEQWELGVQPLRGVNLLYGQQLSVSGGESAWELGDPTKLTTTASDLYQFQYKGALHRMLLSYETSNQVAPNRTTDDTRFKAEYGFGKRTRLTYGERTVRGTQEREEELVESVTRMQEMAVQTAFGLSALHERTSIVGDEDVTQHQRVRFDRAFGPRYEVAAGYEYWENSNDRNFAIAGYKGLLQRATPSALSYDVAVALRPGTTELSAWYRSLRWEQAKEDDRFEEGAHLITETGVSVAQAVSGQFGVRAQWSRIERDSELDLERREVALGYTPKGAGDAITAEVGYRELRDGEGDTRPAVFASARLKPFDGMALEAQLAQQEAKQADALGWEPGDAHAVQVSASQKLGDDGSARVAYTALPMRRDASRDEDPLLARDWKFNLAMPTGFLLPGLQLKGEYRYRTQPQPRLDLERALFGHSATLLWKPDDAHNLSATYHADWTEEGDLRQGESRLELEYMQHFGEGSKLTISAWMHGLANPYDPFAERETYRLGLNYITPF